MSGSASTAAGTEPDVFGYGNAVSILEDFIEVGGLGNKVLVRRNSPPNLVSDIVAALVANQLGIGLAYARKRYVADDVPLRASDQSEVFREIYFTGKRHMEETRRRFREGHRPTDGEFLSEAALIRLSTTYFAAGLLFRTGQLFEAHAVLRLFLEQVAWSYVVRTANSPEDAARAHPTKAIGVLARQLPYVGRLYGFLSDRTHIGLDSHGRFLIESADGPAVLLSDTVRSIEESWLLLFVADAWSVVYESAQARFIDGLENWSRTDSGMELIANRPFVAIRQELVHKLANAGNSAK